MYVPRFNRLDDLEEVRRLVASVGSAQLVTVGSEGYPLATLLPVLWEEDRLVFHMARANDHWRAIEAGAPALAVISGAEAYVSPAWYPSKQEQGRVVPTWNYSAVQLTGRVRVLDDADWVRGAVCRLTDRHEGRRAEPWAVQDAPEAYLAQQLRAIVGLEMTVESVEAKAKHSQNRSEEDRLGVVAGLRREGGRREQQVAEEMERTASTVRR